VLERATSRPAPALTVSAASGGAFAVLALLVALRWPPLMAFDRQREVQLNHLDQDSALFVQIMRAVSAVVSTTGWLVVLGAVALWLLVRRLRRRAVFVAVTGLGNPILNTALKDIFRRPRPMLAHPIDVAGGWSFPSGHTQAATVGCAVLLVVFLPLLGRTAAGWAVVAGVAVIGTVALSRMALGVHYPSDVAAAVLAGLAWTAFSAWMFRPGRG
jgi:membrane-associated phospholipid phosphatase